VQAPSIIEGIVNVNAAPVAPVTSTVSTAAAFSAAGTSSKQPSNLTIKRTYLGVIGTSIILCICNDNSF